MRLDFNVLWVDDQPDRVKAQIKRIAAKMAEEGFEFNPRQCKSMEEMRTALASDVFTDEVDLILVDWDLGGESSGEDAIVAVRESIRYKDVVFYSALKTPDELKTFAFKAGLEGVYCAARGDLVVEVVGVFESLVKKVLDLDHVRGIVMGASSDIDNIVTECLTRMHELLDEGGRQAMVEVALTRLRERVDEMTARASKAQAGASMTDLFEEHLLFTAYDRLKVLSTILKAPEFKGHASKRKSVTTYMSKVVPERNVLGHQVLVPEGKPGTFTTSSGKPMSLAKVRDLRRLILGLRNEFRELLSALKGH